MSLSHEQLIVHVHAQNYVFIKAKLINSQIQSKHFIELIR